MKKNLFLLFVAVIFALNVNAQSTIIFNVVDNDHNPLVGASVDIPSVGTEITDDLGVATFTDIPNSNYNWTCDATGFHQESEFVSVTDETITIDVIMFDLSIDPDQEYDLRASYVGNSGATFHWEPGIEDGAERIVFISQGNAGEPPVIDNTTYVSNIIFGQGDEIDGWYCIFNTGEFPNKIRPLQITCSELDPSLEYRIVAYGFAGEPGSEVYNTSVTYENAINITTTNNPLFVNPCQQSYHDFNITDGSIPLSIVADETHLYGITYYGGAENAGVVYKINKDGTNFQVLHEFDNNNGNLPRTLKLDNSTLYGITYYSTMYDFDGGTVFSINTDGSNFQVLLDLSTNEQRLPLDLEIYENKIYYIVQGTDNESAAGNLYSMDFDGSNLTLLKNWESVIERQLPIDIELFDGVVYGVFMRGAVEGMSSSNNSIIFSINTDGTNYQDIKTFTEEEGQSVSNLYIYNNEIYGTALNGGTANFGTLFKMGLDGSNFQILHDFIGIEGVSPYAITEIDGLLYGSCRQGGVHNYGSLYTINPDGSNFSKFIDFDKNSGNVPSFEELIADNGTIYLTTSGGGVNYAGNIITLCTSAGDMQTVTFFVNDDGTPINNATIDLGFTTITTASDGYASVNIQDGTYAWTCNADTYTERTGSVTVDGEAENVNINFNAPLNTETDIILYSFTEQTEDAVIDDENHTIDIEVANGTDVTELISTFTLSDGATTTVSGTEQTSETTDNDFTDPVIYNVLAEDEIENQDWTITVTVEPNTINKLENSVNIFPNPTTGTFTIETEGNYEITITDISGKVISKFHNFKTSKVDLSNNANGVYFIKFQNSEIVKTIKIIKQ